MNDALHELLVAVRHPNPSKAFEILAEHPNLATATVPAHPAEDDPDGTTLLHWAMPGDGRVLREDHIKIVRLLLESGADPNRVGRGPNHGRCAPLSLAAWGNHLPLITLLLEHGANPNGSGLGRTPLRTATEHNHVDAANVLIEAGATHTFYELLLAGLKERVLNHLDQTPSAATDLLEGDEPPLQVALSTPSGEKLVPILLSRGAKANQRDKRGRTALHSAIDHQRKDAIRILQEVENLDLFAAAGLGETDCALELIDSNPSSILEKQADGTTPLFYAVLADSIPITQALLAAGCDPSPRSTRHWACITPLHMAIKGKQLPLVRELLAGGADANAFGNDGMYFPTPLHVAARWGGSEYLLALLDHHADPLAGGPVRDATSVDVLSWVAFAGKADFLELLVDHGLDVTAKECGAVLHLAAARGHTAIVEQLLLLGVDPKAVDARGKTALERAIEQGQHGTAEILRTLGA
jgi:ankyrin repeat protein